MKPVSYDTSYPITAYAILNEILNLLRTALFLQTLGMFNHLASTAVCVKV